VAFLLAGPMKVRDLFVEGRAVVRQGQMKTIDLAATIGRQNRLAQKLIL
jgi:cytochrome c-type biogenesis protein CcmE